MNPVKTVVKNNGLSLEACLDLPSTPGPWPGVVLCHPHPLYGGDMGNNVIVTISQVLARRGIACLRFNFRGVGRSEGSFANGLGEKEDAAAAISFLAGRDDIDPARIGIAGYSFGGMVALSAGARSDKVKAMAAVSPVVPTGVPGDCLKPKLVICGTEDNMIPSEQILKDAENMPEPKTIQVISRADHFWWGYEEKLAETIAAYFSEYLI